VVSLFNIEEIFPDVGAGSVRLPRQQAGSSPQGLAVTLVADYTLPARAWLPSAAIVALLGEFGVTGGAARTTISRLARRGALEGRQDGRHTSYRLTQPAVVNLSSGGMSIGSFGAQPEPWDGSWTLIAFSLPQEKSTQRRALRNDLRWRGYAPLYDGVWLSPHPLTPPARAMLEAVTPGALTVFRAQHTELGRDAARNPVDAWDIEGIAGQYEMFIRRWRRLLPRITAGKVTGAAAVRARTEVMDIYRRFPVVDPLLPVELMPPDWPRTRAREIFVAVYDGLAEPAEEHVRAVVASVGGEPVPDIRAHTIAEMAAGICGTADRADG
jgi:phenylacetic acid degradation operon negative regulatory protein